MISHSLKYRFITNTKFIPGNDRPNFCVEQMGVGFFNRVQFQFVGLRHAQQAPGFKELCQVVE
jgi:hypothetical protein